MESTLLFLTVTSLDTLFDDLTGSFPKLLTRCFWAIVILLVTRLAVKLVGRLMRRVLNQVEETLRKFFIQVSEVLTLVVGAIAALNLVGIETSTLVAVLGAAGLAVGLAMQQTLSQFAAGVMLISFRPFEVGDLIEGAGVTGVVDSIGLFSTTLLTPDHVKITVPNSNLFSNTLKNMTSLGTRRVDIDLDIGDRPIDSTQQQLLTLVQTHALVLKQPTPVCRVITIAPGKTVLSLRPWCASTTYEQVRSELQQSIQAYLQRSPHDLPNSGAT